MTKPTWHLFGSVLKYTLIALGGAIMLLPFFEMFVGALRTPAERFAQPPVFWPSDPQWSIYREVFQSLPIQKWYINSVIVTAYYQDKT